MNIRNVFTYWTGNKFKVIKLLETIMKLHFEKHNVIFHTINKENIVKYLDNIPENFHDLLPNHQSDYLRVNVVLKYGGIWMDADTLIITDIQSLFNYLDNQNGFFITEGTMPCAGVFGSKPNTKLMQNWKNEIDKIINNKLGWADLGPKLLESQFKLNNYLFDDYKIFDGSLTMYPVFWKRCVDEFILKRYTNYKKIEKKYQPLIILVNSVYNHLENKQIEEILCSAMPINYFINKSLNNLNITHCELIKLIREIE